MKQVGPTGRTMAPSVVIPPTGEGGHPAARVDPIDA